MRWAAAAMIGLASPAGAADLVVRVTGAAPVEGQVLVSVFSSAADYMKRPAGEAVAPIAPDGGAVVRIGGLGAGEVAVSVVHDVNGNGELDLNMLGLPKEDFGFSNNASALFGPPGFDAARIPLPVTGAETLIALGGVE